MVEIAPCDPLPKVEMYKGCIIGWNTIYPSALVDTSRPRHVVTEHCLHDLTMAFTHSV